MHWTLGGHIHIWGTYGQKCLIMIDDGTSIPAGQKVTTRVCVVGGGPAGITLALELASKGIDIIILEAGGLKQKQTSLRDLDGEVVSTDSHATLTQCRSRQLGGTSAQWVGRCLPMDEIDFQARDYVSYSGWPIQFSEISRHYPKASEYCQIGRYDYNVESALPDPEKSIVRGLTNGAVTSNRIERWSLPVRFGKLYRSALSKNKHIHVLLNTTCTGIDLNPKNRTTDSLNVSAAPGHNFHVNAQIYVLAGGGLESTRLLLASNQVDRDGIGNHSGHLGKYYMGHLFGSVAEIIFSGDPRQTNYGFIRDAQGVYCRHRMQIAADIQRKMSIQNTAFWLSNLPPANPLHQSGTLSAAYLALQIPVLRDRLAPVVIQEMFCRDARIDTILPHVKNILRDLPQTSCHSMEYLYRSLFSRRKMPALFVYNSGNRYQLQYHAEHSPNRNSRVTLCDKRDRFGLPQLRVDLRYTHQDIESVVRAHKVLVQELEGKQKLAHIRFNSGDTHLHIAKQAKDGYHQIGTTRMSSHEDLGVVDSQCRVHSVQNLYVCSSSVFPTSGQANPTLTIVALAVRLANHITKTLNDQ
jgi:choline dehydrogenase-like flavoprotein